MEEHHKNCHHKHGRREDKAKVISTSIESCDIYTCPMHPVVKHKDSGHCSICGMTLELVDGR